MIVIHALILNKTHMYYDEFRLSITHDITVMESMSLNGVWFGVKPELFLVGTYCEQVRCCGCNV